MSPEKSEGQVVIGIDTVYDKVLELSGQLVAVLAKDEARSERLERIETTQADHGTRLRRLERWQWGLPAALIGSVLASGAAVVVALAR